MIETRIKNLVCCNTAELTFPADIQGVLWESLSSAMRPVLVSVVLLVMMFMTDSAAGKKQTQDTKLQGHSSSIAYIPYRLGKETDIKLRKLFSGITHIWFNWFSNPTDRQTMIMF